MKYRHEKQKIKLREKNFQILCNFVTFFGGIYKEEVLNSGLEWNCLVTNLGVKEKPKNGQKFLKGGSVVTVFSHVKMRAG